MSDGEDIGDTTAFKIAPYKYKEKEPVRKILNAVVIFLKIINIIFLIIIVPLFIAVLPFILVWYLLFVGPYYLYQLYKSFISKYLISDIRLLLSNPFTSGIYYMYNIFLVTPPILNILVFMGLVFFFIPMIFIYMIYKAVQDKIIDPAIGKILYERKVPDKKITYMDLFTKYYDFIESEYNGVLKFYEKINDLTDVEIMNKTGYHDIGIFKLYGERMLNLRANLKNKKILPEHIPIIRDYFRNMYNYSLEMRKKISFIIYLQKKQIKLIRKTRPIYLEEDQRNYSLRSLNRKRKISSKFRKDKKRKLSSARSDLNSFRLFIAVMRDFAILSRKYIH